MKKVARKVNRLITKWGQHETDGNHWDKACEFLPDSKKKLDTLRAEAMGFDEQINNLKSQKEKLNQKAVELERQMLGKYLNSLPKK